MVDKSFGVCEEYYAYTFQQQCHWLDLKKLKLIGYYREVQLSRYKTLVKEARIV